MRRPRFQSRPLLRGFLKSSNPKDIRSLFLEISGKDIILDYSQLRIACFHFLLNALPKGSIVATSSYTIFDMVNIIISAGHTPFFVDIDKHNLGPDINELIGLIESEKVQGVIYTHLHGYKADLTSLAECCKRKNCILIEDCAQSLWNKNWDERGCLPGSYGDVAVYSSGFFKGVNTICGGLLTLNKSSNFSKKILNSHNSLNSKVTYDFIYRTIYGILFKFVTTDLFFNTILFPVLKISWAKNFVWINKRAREENNPRYFHRDYRDIRKMNLLQHILLNFQNSKSLDRDYFMKSKLAKIYFNELNELIEKEIIYIPGIIRKNNKLTLEGISSYNQIPMLTSKRKQLLDFLVAEGFDIAAQHIRNLSKTAPFDIYKSVNDRVTNDVVNKIILLPCYPNYTEKNVSDLCKKITSFFMSAPSKIV